MFLTLTLSCRQEDKNYHFYRLRLGIIHVTSSVSTFEICHHSARNFTFRSKPFRRAIVGWINAQQSNMWIQEPDNGYMDKLVTLIEFKMIEKHRHHVVFIVLIEVRAASSLTALANTHEWPGICQLIYEVQFKMCYRRTAQPISVRFYTSSTRCHGIWRLYLGIWRLCLGHLSSRPGGCLGACRFWRPVII